MGNIAVSVVVPIYNMELYLEECLVSLEKQTLKDIEVILVNDGSTDRSGDIAKQYADKNKNFLLIERKNGGLSAARNTGLEKATGEYVYFLDSDDYLLSDALETLYKKAKKDNLDVLKFVAYTFSDFSKKLSWTSNGGYKYKGVYPDVYKGIDALQMFIDNGDTSYPSCCLIFSKREIIEKNDLRFYEGIIHEDNLFHWQIMSLSERTAVFNEPLYCSRNRIGSITQTPDWLNKNMSMCLSVEAAEKFAEKHPEIKGKTTAWYIMFFIYMMVDNWNQMSKEMQDSPESISYMKRVKPIAQKYHYGNSISTRLLLTNVTVYRFFRLLKKMAGKKFHR